jgi:hypothetical protein
MQCVDNVEVLTVTEIYEVAIKVYFTFSESISSRIQHGLVCIFISARSASQYKFNCLSRTFEIRETDNNI